MLDGPSSRTTELAKVSVVSVGSVAPVTGAAAAGSGVAASGMCPSPANRAEVGSSPIQPAPGTYASAQACRSVTSSSGLSSDPSWTR